MLHTTESQNQKIQYNNKKNINHTAIVAVLIGIFIFNPILSLIASYFIAINLSENSKNSFAVLKCYFFLFSVFLGLINSTKIPENDLIWYFDGYLDAGKLDFFAYITTFGINAKGYEVGLPILNFIIYKVIGDNLPLYITIITTIYYYLISVAACRIGEKYSIHPAAIATSVLILFIAPNIFSLSAVILRQNMAAALISYVIVEKLVYGKKNYSLMAICFLIHSSSLLFIALLFLPGLKKTASKKTLPVFVTTILLLLFYQQIATLIAGFIPGDNILKYTLTRASIGTNYLLPPLRVEHIAFNLIIVGALITSVYLINPRLKKSEGIVGITNLLLLTLAFIISNLNYIELSVRFNFYFLTFTPFAFMIILSTIKTSTIKPIFITLHLPLFLLFFAGLYNSQWSYEIKSESLYLPAFYYFL